MGSARGDRSILRGGRGPVGGWPRASPRPRPDPARGRGSRGGWPPGGGTGPPPAGRAQRGSRAEARARGRVRPHHVAAVAADGSEASWRSTIKRGFSGGREGEESEGGGRGRGGLLRPRRTGRSAPASQRRPPPPRRHPGPGPARTKKGAEARAGPSAQRPPGPTGGLRAGRAAKMAARAGPRLACSSPEVSSAPSWLELSSFLLTLAAGADMVLLRGWGGSGEGERREGEGGGQRLPLTPHARGRSLGPAASSRAARSPSPCLARAPLAA